MDCSICKKFSFLLGPEEVVPTFAKPLPDVLSVVVSESLKIEASVTGEPRPDIEWFRDNESLKNSDRTVLKSKDDVTQLYIKETDPTDAGNYIVIAKNKLGTVRSTCRVDINTAPAFVKELQEVRVNAGEDARYDVTVSGNPQPTLSWFLNGKSVDSQERFEVAIEQENASLVMKNCAVEDMGDVKCTAINSVGECSSVARLEVAEPIAAPKVSQDVQFEIESPEGGDVLLSLPFSGDGVEIRWLVSSVALCSFINLLNLPGYGFI